MRPVNRFFHILPPATQRPVHTIAASLSGSPAAAAMSQRLAATEKTRRVWRWPSSIIWRQGLARASAKVFVIARKHAFLANLCKHGAAKVLSVLESPTLRRKLAHALYRKAPKDAFRLLRLFQEIRFLQKSEQEAEEQRNPTLSSALQKNYIGSLLFPAMHDLLSLYLPMLYAIGLAVGLCLVLAGGAYLLSLSMTRDAQQLSEYECGFEPFDSATRLPFDVHFYLVGVLFLIFDVEIALLFPWVLGLKTAGGFSFYLMFFFVGLLGLGFFYEGRRGALIGPTEKRVAPGLLFLLPETLLGLVLCLLLLGVALHVEAAPKPRLALVGRRGVLGGLGGALLSCLLLAWQLDGPTGYACDYLMTTPISLFFKFLTIASALFVLLHTKTYLAEHPRHLFEFPPLYLLAVLFMLFLLSANHLLVAFFSIVGFSLNVYVLVLLDAHKEGAREAGIKYFLLSAHSSGGMLFGLYLIFSSTEVLTGSLLVAASPERVALHGLAFFLVGLYFKLAVVPAHLGAAEIYEGSSHPMTAFFMLPVKVAVLGFLTSVLTISFQHWEAFGQPLVAAGTGLSLLIGCFGALYEKKFKRFLAYASINQMGFLLLGLVTGSVEGLHAFLFYVLIYVLMNIGFLVVLLTYRRLDGAPLLYLTDLRGLGRASPLQGGTATVMLFSMAGIPPLAGFLGKYYLLYHAFEAQQNGLVLLGIATSLLSTAYYLRLIRLIGFEGQDVMIRSPQLSRGQIGFLYFLNTALVLFPFWLGGTFGVSGTSAVSVDLAVWSFFSLGTAFFFGVAVLYYWGSSRSMRN